MCATLCGIDTIADILEEAAEYFSEVITCANGKTTPKVYRTALLHLGTAKDETYVFEDAYYAAKTAKEDGFSVVGDLTNTKMNGKNSK